jgi:CheY-like chemotaxis protein
MNTLQKKILVVDDDPVIRRSFDRVLSESGYEVSTAHDGSEALASMSREEYDVVFTDIKMPGMDGLELAERIRETRPWVPVVIVTGYGSPENVKRAELAGVAGFLDKPLSPATIERSTRAALRVIEGGVRTAQREPAVAPPAPAEAVADAGTAVAAIEEARPENRAVAVLKSTGLYLAAPFCALAYMVATAFVMLGALGWMAIRPLTKPLAPILPFLKNVGLFLAAPFVGLAYVIAFPFVGAAVLLSRATRALLKRPGRS